MTKLRKARGSDGLRLMHWCPGCDQPHGIRTHTTDDDDKPLPAPVQETLCHYFIHKGKIEFCGDSPHKFAGQTIDIPDWPYAPGAYGGIEED